MTERKLKGPEVLAPAGTLEKFTTVQMQYISVEMHMGCVLGLEIFHLKRWKRGWLLRISMELRFM